MRLFLAALAGVALYLLGLTLPAPAHDHWINNGNFVSPIDGLHCCGENDCDKLRDEDVREVEGGFYIDSLKEFVPRREVQFSRDGHFWRCRKADGSRRCFFAPPP